MPYAPCDNPHKPVDLLCNRCSQTEIVMHSQGIENGMVIGAQDAIDDRAAHADREAKAFEMFVREFLDAVREGPEEPVSWYEQRVPLHYAVCELLDGPDWALKLVRMLREPDDLGLCLAEHYAKEQVAYYARIGAL